MTAALTTTQSRLRLIAILCWLAIILVVVLHQLWPAPTNKALIASLIYCIPLLLPLRGLLHGDRYTYSWATLCVLPYFIVGVTEAVSNPAVHTWATALLGTSLLWFFSLIAFLRVTRAK